MFVVGEDGHHRRRQVSVVLVVLVLAATAVFEEEYKEGFESQQRLESDCRGRTIASKKLTDQSYYSNNGRLS